ncbi:MAG: signal recognition particle-docking protein FtsY [Lamprocystis purpurea]|jgi:fused signal recognition particle receptor|nr:signal recognition particle-docking protein FtsY [Lamprocystis purpurea]
MFGFGKKKQQETAASEISPQTGADPSTSSGLADTVAGPGESDQPVEPGVLSTVDEAPVPRRGLFARLGFGRQRPEQEFGWIPGLVLPPPADAAGEGGVATPAESPAAVSETAAVPPTVAGIAPEVGAPAVSQAITIDRLPAAEVRRPSEAKPVAAAPAVVLPRTVTEQFADEESPEVKLGLFKRLRERLTRSRTQLGTGLGNLFLGRKRIDDELMEELETLLLTADVGVDATTRIIADLTARVRRKSLADPQALLAALKQALREILATAHARACPAAPGRPQVILMVGVNGAGKTTTIGKLAKLLQAEGNSVMLAAGDTFRAAAVEQLQAWGERNRVPVIAQKGGADSASVIFDALQAATARGIDVLIADTAGRLHTKTNLMDELSKIARVMRKIDPDAPHEVMLVVDATTGQNALTQAVQFHQTVGLTGIALTKLDGTAKGGIVFAIAERIKVPIRFIGVGESIEDLRPFDADEFLDALLS